MVSDSEEEEEDEGGWDARKPRVTRLEEGAKVQIGPDGSTVFHNSNSRESSSTNRNVNPAVANSLLAKVSSSGLGSGPESRSDPSPESISTDQAPGLILKNENGGTSEKFSWSQNRYEVLIQSVLPNATKAADLSFDVREKYLRVSITGAVYFGGNLAYPIDIDEEDTISGGIVWEVNEYKAQGGIQRILEFSIVKKSPIPGSFIWWKHVYPCDPEIDVSKIQGRSSNLVYNSSEWDLAHKMFKDKISSMKSIPLSDRDESDKEGES